MNYEQIVLQTPAAKVNLFFNEFGFEGFHSGKVTAKQMSQLVQQVILLKGKPAKDRWDEITGQKQPQTKLNCDGGSCQCGGSCGTKKLNAEGFYEGSKSFVNKHSELFLLGSFAVIIALILRK